MSKEIGFIFSWDQLGIESIVPLSEYEKIDKDNLILILKGEKPMSNPLNNIIRNLILRANANPQRHYEIYAITCDPELDLNFWKEQWQEQPQFTAELIRDRGHQLYSARQNFEDIVIK